MSHTNEFNFEPYDSYNESNFLNDIGFEPYENSEESNEESIPHLVTRNISSHGVRALESIAGIPGDISSLFNSIATIGATPEQKEAWKKVPSLSAGQITGQKINTENTPPTSTDIRQKVTKPLTGESLEPHSNIENTTQNIIQDLSQALVTRGSMTIPKVFAQVGLSNLGEQVALGMGLDESDAAKVKLGINFATGLLMRDSAKKYAQGLYDKAENLVPDSAKTGSENLKQNITQAIKSLEEGTTTGPSKTEPLKFLNEFRKRLGESELVPVKELIKARKNINDVIYNTKLTRQGNFNMEQAKKLIDKQLMVYGKSNPEFLKQFQDATTAWYGLKSSEQLTKEVTKKLGKAIDTVGPHTAMLLGIKAFNPHTLAATGTGLATAWGARLLKRVTVNPVLRKHYLSVLAGASKDAAPVLARKVNLLDKAMRDDPEIQLIDFSNHFE
jgi:hypothetical protein